MKKRIILCLVMLSFLCIALSGCGNKDERVFKCSEWKLVAASVSNGEIVNNTINVLKEYKSYTLVLNDNGLFNLEYSIENKQYTVSGSYKEENNTIYLTYTDTYAEEIGCYPTYTVSADGKTLSRSQFNETYNWTVKQTFNLK